MQVFVGRAGELEALSAVAVSATAPAAAIVVGEPGSGKSRLLAEARIRTALPHSYAVVGYEPERQVPLAAAAGLLRALSETPQHGSHLEALLFGAHEATPLEPVRVFEAAHRAFRTLEPALLVVDDLQWVDDLSLALCHYLIRAARESDQRLVIFAATRSGGGVSLADALPPERVRWIELAPLSREEGIELVLGLGAGLDRGLAGELWEQAKGSPFWLEALARAGGSAAGLSQVLTVQLRGAGADPATLLALLAVAGRPIPVTDAGALAQWPQSRTEAALRELLDRGIVVEAGGTARLTHDLIRDAAVADLSDEVRRRIHCRLAEQLELVAGSDLRLLRRALEHRRAGGMPTLDLGLQLVRSSHRKLLGAEGLGLLAGIADEADPLGADALALQEEVASLAAELAEYEVALARWSLVADRSEVPQHQAFALLAASKAAYALARVEDARELLVRSREIGAADDVLELEQRTHEGEIRLWLEQRATEGPVLARGVVAAANRLAARAGGVSALDSRGRRSYLYALQLEYEAAVQQADTETMLRSAEARAAAARGFDLESYLAASLAACVALRWAGRAREAAMRSRSVWTEAHRHIFPRLAVDAGEALAGLLHITGELAEAERIVHETSELAARAGDLPRARHRVARVACNVALERSQPWAALERLERETAEEPNEHQRIAFHGDVALWSSRLKRPPAAAVVREHVAAGHADAEKVGCPRCEAELLLLSAEALARVGDREQARRLLAAWDSRSSHPNEQAALVRLRAGALAQEDATARAAQLESVLESAEGSPFRLEALWTRLDLGFALADAGNDRAAAELERAAAAAEELGAGTVKELADRALRSLGVRTWRRVSAGTPLTEREQEVARLVAEGATNREIAQTLFLSPKTVERHVSNVFKKVGVRNRAELATRLWDLAAEHAGVPDDRKGARH
jgi:DNA-binding NarL/FixJ family response regulator